LADLGLTKTNFQVRITPLPVDDGGSGLVLPGVSPSGREKIEFLISVNPGEALKPLKLVASGGEISRIMLALKHILASTAGVECLVFDEIDVGIGGRTAEIVARKLKAISRHRQLIVITHLPAIARLADNHIVVDKREIGGRAHTRIRKVEGQERVMEIARMLGGEITGRPSETAISHARELLNADGK